MYLPPHFEETDAQQIAELMLHYPLAALVCQHEGEFIVNHLPLFAQSENRLTGHIAKANSLHEILADGTQAVAIFRAEDAYISPNWYPTKALTHRHVPTWNYQVVHLHGRLYFTHDDKAKRAVVGRLTQTYEQMHFGDRAWKMSDAPQDYMQGMLDNIVAFHIEIDRIAAKSKLSQNREQTDYDAVQQQMKATGRTGMADAMGRLKQGKNE